MATDICADHPNAFWDRKKNIVTLSYEDSFSESDIPTKSRPCQMNAELVDFCKKEIDSLLQKGLIKPFKSPWSFSAFYVNNAAEQERGVPRWSQVCGRGGRNRGTGRSSSSSQQTRSSYDSSFPVIQLENTSMRSGQSDTADAQSVDQDIELTESHVQKDDEKESNLLKLRIGSVIASLNNPDSPMSS
ncbi:uncharacterized protein [Solanum lycopersicum]|uniref:uncharacterized protein n=1 Tax=Solanum lycopersicum TaxID=4081 RepID=UPI00374970B3